MTREKRALTLPKLRMLGLLLSTVCTAQSQQQSARLDPPLKDWQVSQFWTAAAGTSTVAGATQATPAASNSPLLTFVAITPCRLMDTRPQYGFTGSFGPPALLPDLALNGSVTRKIPIPSSSCGVPSAAAYSVLFSVQPPPGGSVSWLSAWPDDQPWPGTVVLNAPSGGIVSGSAIVASGADGGIQVEVTNPTDLVIDINGYFVPSSPR